MGYAVVLHIEKRNVVIVGGGRVAARKVRSLVAEGAKVTVISPQISPSIAGAVHVKLIKWVKAEFASVNLSDYAPFMVIAATHQPEVNTKVAQSARDIGALFSAVDNSAPSDFSAMMTVNQPPITIGISTDGTSPALGTRLRTEIEAVITQDYAILAEWLGEIRQTAKSTLNTSDERRDLFHRVIDSDVLDLLKAGQTEIARAKFDQFIQEAHLDT